MLTLLRRVLVLAALLFWQGGFLFYASVVVPVGQDVLGSAREQGFITRRVTEYLNLSGALALLPLAWDVAISRDAAARRRLRWACWMGMALTLGLLFWLHPRLDALLDPERGRILDRHVFHPLHRWYLWSSTIQWACGVVYIVLTLWAWRHEDRATGQVTTTAARPAAEELPA